MSKRTDTIRSMFTMPQSAMLSADNSALVLPRVAAGSIRALKDTFSVVERENLGLREQLEGGFVAFDLDPGLIDPSPLADRFLEQDPAAFEQLKASIRQKGQEIPILVREHPSLAGRFQNAYGHCRVRVARELGISIKAYVRKMSDEDLVVAQGIENSAREDLSFIERAVFAARLETAGFQRSVVQSALTVDRAEASKLVAVAKAIPDDLIIAVGRAPKVGRGRWQALADALKASANLRRARAAVQTGSFAQQATDARFLAVLAAATKSDGHHVAPLQLKISSRSGDEITKTVFTDSQFKLTVRRAEFDGFAEYLVEKLPDLFDAYEAQTRFGERLET